MKSLLKLGTSALAGGVLLFSWATAQAGTAELTSGDGDASMSYEYSADMLRMNMEGQASYMLVRDNTVYMVTDTGGSMMVIDASQAWSMVSGMAGTTTPDMMAHEVISLEPTGRLEQHAGASGEVYLLRSRSSDGKEQQAELVLSKDPRALEFRDAMHRMALTMTRVMGDKEARNSSDDVHKRLQALDKGVLRYGNDMKVTRLTQDPVDPARFVLPAAPADLSGLSGLGAIFGGQTSGTGADSKSGGSIWDSMRESMGGGEAEEPGDGEEETEGAAAELGKALGRIFGN